MRDVRSTVGFGHCQAGDGLAAEHGNDDALDEFVRPGRVAALTPAVRLVHDVGERDAVAEEARDDPAAAAGLQEGLGHDHDVHEVTAGSPDLLGEADAEDAGLRSLAVELEGELPGPLPVGEVRGDLAAGEVGDQGPQGAALGGGVGVEGHRVGGHAPKPRKRVAHAKKRMSGTRSPGPPLRCRSSTWRLCTASPQW